MQTPKLLEAIRVVKENERIASDTYADAAKKIRHQMGKEIFEQLSQFEKYHYDKISALEKSLEEKGEFIEYESKDFPLPPIFDVGVAKDPNEVSMIEMIQSAIKLEQKAEKTYASLAVQIKDPQGHKMFTQLAEEEHVHYRILVEGSWAITNLRPWIWTRPKNK